jgi:CBS domain-containing protein
MNALPISPENTPPYLTEIVHRLKIRDVMSTTLVTASPATSLREVQSLMKEHRITGVPIVRDSRLAGIVSIDDIIRALDEDTIDSSASSRMTRQIIALEDDMPLSFGISYMEKFHFGRFPVLNRDKKLVGIITSRDILNALVVELNREAEAREDEISRQTVGETTHHRFQVRQYDFERAGVATDSIKLRVRELNLPAKLVRRIAVASYELEMNMIVHSVGGTMSATVGPDGIEVVAADAGPGIPSLDDALREGFTTAPEWIRSLGFGAGMGLPNARRMSDEFRIESSQAGTTVTVRFSTNVDNEV